VIAELGVNGEALLLYDLDVEGIETLRVAEHFTVADGSITKIRHVHDTAALRKAGFGGHLTTHGIFGGGWQVGSSQRCR
jgi:hypothetical protein